MKPIGLYIDWNKQYANDNAEIFITVDKEPDLDAFRWNAIKEDERRVYYWAEHDGLLRAFRHDPANENGFGGNVFKLKMQDGTVEHVRGPWDCGTSLANKLLENNYVEVALNTMTGPYLSYTAWKMEVKQLESWLQSFDQRLVLTQIPFQAYGLGDQQGRIIAHGAGMKPDTFIYELKKDLKAQFPYNSIEAGSFGERHYTIWGQSRRREIGGSETYESL